MQTRYLERRGKDLLISRSNNKCNISMDTSPSASHVTDTTDGSTTWSKPQASGATYRRSYSAGVSDHELETMSLTASVCRTVNGRMRKNYLKYYGKQRHVDFRNVMRANDAFFVKTGHDRFYGSTLTFPRDLTLTPTSVCPDVDAHDAHIVEYALPLACPTCWSAQRNGLSSQINTKADKIRVKKSPLCKGKKTASEKQ